MNSQCRRILDRLERGSATSWELGPSLGILRLSARVQELRAAGYEISWTEKWERGQRIVTYCLKGQREMFHESVKVQYSNDAN